MISSRGRYALRVMIDLARQNSDGYVPLKEIAERQAISKKYLEIIAKELVNAFLSGKRRRGLSACRCVRHPPDVDGAESADP